MSKEFDRDGWIEEDGYDVVDNNDKEMVRYRGEKALSILEAKHYSLEPDMISGWRPKLPSCPLPLTYPNIYVDALMKHLVNEENYAIAYVGARLVNSVQINQKYEYFWRYRERYSLNLAIIKEAVTKIGNDAPPELTVSHCKHTFDSSFQSGNLDLAVRVKPEEYDCFIRSDTNTKGHTNWYYFRVTNRDDTSKVRINICNMTKTRNLYSKGMKPYVKIGKNGTWSQEHSYDVIFVQRYCRYGFDKKTYQLQFSFNFTEPEQEVYFAYGIPFTYTDLEKFVKEIKQSHPSLVKSRRLCESLGGVELPLLTITNPDSQNDGIENNPDNQQVKVSKKKAVLLTARIHPGESNSSHVLEGFIRKLLEDCQSSNILRTMFVFYVVPMLNPDGVIAGNFRTSYSGKDLNRQFNKLNKYIFPEITALCEFCHNIRRSYHRGIDFYFDFHGHSAKKNLFCYGPDHPSDKIYFFKARALAKIIQKMSPIFSYRKSIFTISESKKTTGRAYMMRNLKIPMTFTFEISNGMYQNSQKTDVKLNQVLLHEAGRIVVDGLYRYAQLEMKLPKKNIRAKINTNKDQRALNSSYQRRGDISKKKSSQEINERKSSLNSKSMKKSYSEEKNSSSSSNKEFIALLKEIKDEQEKHIEIEGGSDSQGSEDDLEKQDTVNLFAQIMKRNQQSSYNFRMTNKARTTKLNYKAKEDQQNTQEQVQTKKYHSSRMLELSKPPIASNRNIKRGISYEYDKVVVAQKNFTMLL